MAPNSSSLLPLLLLCFFYGYHVSGEEQFFRTVRVDTLLPAAVCSTRKGFSTGGNSLRVVHRRGPCSPLAGVKPNHARTLLRQDVLRVESLQRRLSREASVGGQTQASEVALPAQRGITFGTANYVVTLGLGTPGRDQTVVFDTGSNVCWVQCQPCVGSCYPQQGPVFDPAASSTYSNVSCGSTACGNLDVRGCSGTTCLYGVKYGDNSTTVGFLATDTLTLAPGYAFPGFVFGCGQRNQGLFGKVAGLVGLGRSSFSLVSQASQRLGKAFSYCLPATSSSTGHLTIGESAASKAASYTPMLTDPRDSSLYFLTLTGISVGGQLLPVSPSVFQSAGTLIDSGTVITRLPPSAYSALRSAFRAAMAKYPMAPPRTLLDTCYDFSNTETISYPVVSLHFGGGAELQLELPGIFYVADISQACLGFAGNGSPGDVGIIGNVQQRTAEVVYDIGGGRIGFSPKACS
uniref:Aspartic proteinase nepenthesin-1 n=2 Tax=Anthurium amnicola TaxID=1678845 RepID=A0A1D1YQ62_9ARAE